MTRYDMMMRGGFKSMEEFDEAQRREEERVQRRLSEENKRAFEQTTPNVEVQPVNRWISVKDRLPEIGKSVLIYYPKWDGDEIQVAKLEDDGMMFDICGEFNAGTGVITHWMSLPEPPKDGEQNG